MNGWAIAFFVLLVVFLWFLIIATKKIEEATDMIKLQDEVIGEMEKRVKK